MFTSQNVKTLGWQVLQRVTTVSTCEFLCHSVILCCIQGTLNTHLLDGKDTHRGASAWLGQMLEQAALKATLTRKGMDTSRNETRTEAEKHYCPDLLPAFALRERPQCPLTASRPSPGTPGEVAS